MRLTQYIFAQIAVLIFVLYLMMLIWRRPHKWGLLVLLAVCILSVIRSQDVISVASATVVSGCVLLLYRNLHLAAAVQVEEKLKTT